MNTNNTTRHSLLVQIRDLQNRQAWGEFVEAYAPLVYRYASKHGLQDADAGDLTQEVLRSVAAAAGEFVYDPARGRFRTWLFTVSRNKVLNFLARQKHVPQASADTATWQQVYEQPDPASDSVEWDRDYERQLFHWACQRVRGQFREATWQAFWLTAVDDESPGEVAARLAMSVGAVYIAKSRVLAAIKQEVERLVGEESF